VAAGPEHGRIVLTMSLVGAPRLFVGAAPVRVPNRKLLAALAILAMAETGRETRERLVGLLWSESDEALARGSLRQAMAGFRRICGQLGFEGLEADREAIAFAPGSVVTDIAEIEGATGGGKVHPALIETTDLPGRLMLTCDELDPAMRSWLAAAREGWRERLLRRLTADLGTLEPGAAGEEDVARAVLRLDQAHEPAARRLMSARARAGDPAAAIRVYDTLWSVLEEEHDLEPSDETASLAVAIKSGEVTPSTRSAASARSVGPAETAPVEAPSPPVLEDAGAAPLLIVEPFAVSEVGADGAARAEGFRHALMASLARFREWRVADGAAASGAEPPAAGRYRLRARAEGSRLVTALTLVEADSGVLLWSDRFALEGTGVEAARDRLLRQLTAALTLHLTRDRLACGDASGGPGLWLRGRDLLRRWTPDAWAEAETLLETATERTPDWAPGWATLALARALGPAARPGRMRDPAGAAAALVAARRAAALDPLDARAALALGWASAAAGRWQAAGEAAAEALGLNGDDPRVLTLGALLLAAAGRGEAALAPADAALETEAPDAGGWALHAALRFLSGDEAGAEEAARMAEGVAPLAGLWRAAALARRGEPEAARDAFAALRGRLREVWEGETFCDAAAARWLLQALPVRDPAVWRRLRDALALAGAPVEGARFETAVG